jgi:alpha-tubulin suppressor-like RCC1 family protein
MNQRVLSRAGRAGAQNTHNFNHIRAAGCRGRRRPLLHAALFLSLAAIAGTCLTASPARAGETTTALQVSQPASVYSEKMTLTATVTGAAPSGTVQFRDGSKSIGTARLTAEPTAYVAVSVAGEHSCALIDDGAVQCWGVNEDGELGDGTLVSRSVPTPVVGLTGPAIAVAAAQDYSCALIQGGGVQCWGVNNNGELGDGTTDDSTTAVTVTGLAGPATAVSATGGTTCALITGGTMQCWGNNDFGEMGTGNTTDSLTPVSVTGLAGAVTAIATGQNYTCALITGGTVQCWGLNSSGQLGDGTSGSFNSNPTPISVAGLSGAAIAVVASNGHTCALITGGTVQCWGRNSDGQLGDGTKVDRTTPVTVVDSEDDPLTGVTAISASPQYTCAVIEDGGIRCWGDNGIGELGTGTTDDSTTAVPVVDLGGAALSVDGGFVSTCAFIEGGSIQCWGSNFDGNLGDGTTDDSLVPVDVLDPARAAANRRVTIVVDSLDAGLHVLTAGYLGDDANAGSTSEIVAHTVSKADTKIKQIKLKPKTPKAGKTAKATVKVQRIAPATEKPDGKMKIALDGRTIANVKVRKGKAKFALPAPAAGRHKLKVRYNGTGNFAKSAGKATFNVKN